MNLKTILIDDALHIGAYFMLRNIYAGNRKSFPLIAL